MIGLEKKMNAVEKEIESLLNCDALLRRTRRSSTMKISYDPKTACCNGKGYRNEANKHF